MKRLLALLVANGLTLVILARVIPDDVGYTGLESVAIFAVLLAALNATVRPLLQLIALPLTCLTMGLFAFIINVVVFYAAAALSVGIEISYLGALVGTLVASVLGGLLNSVVKD